MRDVRKHDIGKYTNRLVDFLEGAAISIGKLLFSVIVLFVVSIYMLLDFPNWSAGSTGGFHRSQARCRWCDAWSSR